jgi:hypothetical protein
MQAKGINGVLSAQYEQYGAYGVTPTVVAATKLYFETEGFKGSRNMVSSNVQTGNRHPTKPTAGNVDVTGQLATELMVYPAMMYYSAFGSIDTTVISATGEVLATALTAPTGVVDPFNQIMTITSASHTIAVGDVVKLTGLTQPAGLIARYCRCVASNTTAAPVVTPGGITLAAYSFVVRIPLGNSGAIVGTLAVAKVTTPGQSYQHVIKAGGVLPSLQVEKGFPDIGQYLVYNGVKCSKMSLGVDPEAFQKLSFDFMGKKETLNTTPFCSTVTDLGKTSLAGFQIATLEEGSTLAALGFLTKLDVSLDNAIDGSTYTVGGAGTRGALNEGTVKLSGSAEVFFQDVTLYNKAVAGTPSGLHVTYNNGTGVGTSGNESFDLLIPELLFTQQTPTISGDKGVLVTLPFEAYYGSSAQQTTCQITLKTPQLAV